MSKINTSRAKLLVAIDEGKVADVRELYRTYCSIVDRAAKAGVIRANAASRRKSRASARIAALAKA